MKQPTNCKDTLLNPSVEIRFSVVKKKIQIIDCEFELNIMHIKLCPPKGILEDLSNRFSSSILLERTKQWQQGQKGNGGKYTELLVYNWIGPAHRTKTHNLLFHLLFEDK